MLQQQLSHAMNGPTSGTDVSNLLTQLTSVQSRMDAFAASDMTNRVKALSNLIKEKMTNYTNL